MRVLEINWKKIELDISEWELKIRDLRKIEKVLKSWKTSNFDMISDFIKIFSNEETAEMIEDFNISEFRILDEEIWKILNFAWKELSPEEKIKNKKK